VRRTGCDIETVSVRADLVLKLLLLDFDVPRLLILLELLVSDSGV